MNSPATIRLPPTAPLVAAKSESTVTFTCG
jgi:hypothetical protein